MDEVKFSVSDCVVETLDGPEIPADIVTTTLTAGASQSAGVLVVAVVFIALKDGAHVKAGPNMTGNRSMLLFASGTVRLSDAASDGVSTFEACVVVLPAAVKFSPC